MHWSMKKINSERQLNMIHICMFYSTFSNHFDESCLFETNYYCCCFVCICSDFRCIVYLSHSFIHLNDVKRIKLSLVLVDHFRHTAICLTNTDNLRFLLFLLFSICYNWFELQLYGIARITKSNVRYT